MKRITFALLALAFSAFPSLAQVVCLPVDQVLTVAKEKGLVTAMQMLGKDGEMYQIIVDPKSGAWAAIAIGPKGDKACFVAEGPKFQLAGVGA